MPAFFTRDSLQASLCSCRTVGLKLPAPIQKFIPLVSKLSSSIDCATRCGGKVIFSQVNGKDAAILLLFYIGKFDHNVKKPTISLTDQLTLSKLAPVQIFSLSPPNGKGALHATMDGKEREHVTFQRKGAGTIVDTRSLFVGDFWNGIGFFDPKGLVATTYFANPVAYHLRTKVRQRFSYCRITKVVQGNLVPAAMFLSAFGNLITALIEQQLGLQKNARVFFEKIEPERNRTQHARMFTQKIKFKQEERRFLPALKDRVSAPSL